MRATLSDVGAAPEAPSASVDASELKRLQAQISALQVALGRQTQPHPQPHLLGHATEITWNGQVAAAAPGPRFAQLSVPAASLSSALASAGTGGAALPIPSAAAMAAAAAAAASVPGAGVTGGGPLDLPWQRRFFNPLSRPSGSFMPTGGPNTVLGVASSGGAGAPATATPPTPSGHLRGGPPGVRCFTVAVFPVVFDWVLDASVSPTSRKRASIIAASCTRFATAPGGEKGTIACARVEFSVLLTK
jgi:hypothetical protein